MTVGNPPAPLAPTAAVSARAYRNAAFTTGATFAKIPLDTVSYDTAGAVQIGNSRFVCPIAGSYEVNGEVYATATAAGQAIIAGLAINGTVVAQGVNATAQAAGSISSSVSDVLRLNVGDAVELWAAASIALALLVAPSLNYLSVKG